MLTLRCGYRDVATDMDNNIKHNFNDPYEGKKNNLGRVEIDPNVVL